MTPQELEKRGYSNYKITEDETAIYELEDGTILEINMKIKNILYQNPTSVGFIDGYIDIINYSTVDLRSETGLDEIPDVKTTMKQEGKLVFEVNGFKTTMTPVIIQIKRLNQKDNFGIINYQISVNAKTIMTKL